MIIARSAKLSEAARRELVREYGGNEVKKSSRGYSRSVREESSSFESQVKAPSRTGQRFIATIASLPL